MPLSYDGERTIEEKVCSDCGRPFLLLKAFLSRHDEPYAVTFVALHRHGGPEAWIDVIFGAWGSEDPADVPEHHDHLTFGCRVGAVDGQDTPAASLVPAAAPYVDSSWWGEKLDPDGARAHPLLPDFWKVVDHLIEADPVIHGHVYGVVVPTEVTEQTFGRRLGGWSRSRRRRRS